MLTATIVRSNPEQLEGWQKLYRDHLKLTTDFQGLKNHWKRQEDRLGVSIIERRGLGRLTKLVVVPQGVDANRLYEACAKQFTCWCSVDDFSVIRSGHAAVDGDVACWIEPAPEAPEELANRSADDLRNAGISTLVLDGYLAYGLDYYFEKTGDHLDRENWTIFPGSRGPDGFVLGAFWFGVRFRVDWWDSGVADPHIRGRAAVYL